MKFSPELYQQQASRFLLEHPRAGLYMSCGMGKSASVLSALNELFLTGAARSALIVAPLRVANLTWPNEVEKWDFCRDWKVESLRGRKPSGEAEIYTINYDQLLTAVYTKALDPATGKNKFDVDFTPTFTDLSFCDVVVFDEITRAKNPKSARIAAIRNLLKDHRRWGLTGTPRPNSLLEIFAQIRLLDDGKRLGPSFHQFQRSWFHATDYNEYNWEPNPNAEQSIYKRIHDLVLTLRASDYLDQPDLVVEDVEVALPKDAHDLYRKLERELLVSMGPKGTVVAQNAATLVNKLLQISGGTVYNETRGVVEIHDGKIKALKRLLAEIGAENVIIFTNYIHERERVCEAIGGTDASAFKGDTEAAWNGKGIRYLVADPRSLGHGLNLQKGGSKVVWFSPTWSREYYDQANARVARKGQEDVTTVYRLLSPGTIDDAVVESLREKGEGQNVMLSVLTNFRRQGLTFT